MSVLGSIIGGRLAASHLAGPDVSDAVGMARVFSDMGWHCTLGAWAAPDSTPRENFILYCRGIEALAASGLDGYFSIKLCTLGYDRAMFEELAGLAAGHDIRVHCDSMDPLTADRTMSIIGQAHARYENIGSTLPAGWRRSRPDAEKLADWGVPVRIVKGQWGDPDRRVTDIRAAFVTLAGQLAGRGLRISVATHDRSVALRSLALLTGAGTDCEMEQISGLPQNCSAIAGAAGVPFRVYIPYGFPYLPYNIWQVRTRPAVALWALRDFIAGKHRRVGEPR